MKNLSIDKPFKILALLLFVIGLCFSYMVAEIDDAPGFIIFGFAGTCFGSFLIYGLGRLIEIQKESNSILKDIENKIKK